MPQLSDTLLYNFKRMIHKEVIEGYSYSHGFRIYKDLFYLAKYGDIEIPFACAIQGVKTLNIIGNVAIVTNFGIDPDSGILKMDLLYQGSKISIIQPNINLAEQDEIFISNMVRAELKAWDYFRGRIASKVSPV